MVLNLTFALKHTIINIEYALLSSGLSLQSMSLAELLHTLLLKFVTIGDVQLYHDFNKF